MTRKEIEQWAVHGIIPGEYEIYGDWILHKSEHILNLVGGGIVFHDHGERDANGWIQRTLYAILPSGRCRHCGEMAPPGVVFRAKTFKLQGAQSASPQQDN
jgi:hypothetical protein